MNIPLPSLPTTLTEELLLESTAAQRQAEAEAAAAAAAAAASAAATANSEGAAVTATAIGMYDSRASHNHIGRIFLEKLIK